MTASHKYPFLILAVTLISGIICGDYFYLPHPFFYAVSGCAVLLLYIARTFFGRYIRIFNQLSDLVFILVIFITGLILGHPAMPPEITGTYHIKSRYETQLSGNNHVLSVNDQKLYLSRFDADTVFQAGDSLAFTGKTIRLGNNSNTGEFNYNNYLRQQGIYFRVIPASRIAKTGGSQDFFSFFEKIRTQLMDKTAHLLHDPTNSSLIDALCLGFRNDLDSEIQELFISTGTIHLLSVSGLHVGAIYLLITFLLNIIGISNRKAGLLIIPLIWGYACLTGLSPSVVRASTILSFISIGKILNRDYTPLNSISAAAFFTLLIQPQAIYSVSFQLSYAAYTGIITLYPFFNRLPGHLPAIPAKIYSLICITVSAQLATIPISVYYFHTLNITGFLANIIAVPISTILLYVATFFLLLPYTVSAFLAFIVNAGCELLFYSLELLNKISINITDLHLSLPLVVFLYLDLLFICLYFFKRERLILRFSIISTFMTLCYCCLFNIYLHSRQEIIIFNINKKSCILFNYKGYYGYLKNNTLPGEKITPYIMQNKLRELPGHTGFMNDNLNFSNNTFKFKDLHISIADKHYPKNNSADILIVTDNIPPEKLFRIKETENANGQNNNRYPGKIITDGSNDTYHNNLWEKFCREKGIDFQRTYEYGSITLTLK